MHGDLQASWIKRGSTGRRWYAKVLPCHSLSQISNTSWWSGWKIKLIRWPINVIWSPCQSQPYFNGQIVIAISQWSTVVFSTTIKPTKRSKTWSWVYYNSKYTLKHALYLSTLIAQSFLTLSRMTKYQAQAKASPSTFNQRWSNMGAWQPHLFFAYSCTDQT